MADISNKQLLNALTDQLGTITDNMATKTDVKEIVREETTDIRDEQLRQGVLLNGVVEMLSGVSDTVIGIANSMATTKDIKRLDHKIDNAELRLGRRIDAALLAKTGR